MMKRSLSLLLALIMVVGLLPNTLVFAADANDDIYIDESSSLEELEDLGIVDYDECDPWLDAPEEVENPQPDMPDMPDVPDIFMEDPEIPSEHPEEPGEELEIPGDFSEYPDEPSEELAEPVEPDEWIEDHPEMPSPSDPFQDSPETDLSDRYSSADSDGQFQNGTGVGSGSLGGFVSEDMVQGNAEVTTNMVWTANATGANVCEGTNIASDTLSFTNSGSYEIQIVPNSTDASADGATQLHINLYQLYISNGTTVRVYLDADAFEYYSDITEVVIHISDNVNLLRVYGGSLTLEGLPGCKLVLDGKSLDGKTAFTASPERVLLRLGGGNGVDNVTVRHATFRNAPRSAVYVYGGLMESITFKNCKFESTCANSEVITGATSNRNGGAIRFAPYNSTTEATTSTLVEELTIDTCEFVGNTAMQYGGAVCLYGVFDQVEIKNSTFTNTSVSERTGGAIGMVGMFNKVDILNNTFDGCTASVSESDTGGGAIGVRATVGKLTIDSDFSSCSTSQKGGAIYVAFAALTSEMLPHLTETVHTRINTLEISGSNFTECSSGERGGAICLDAQIGNVIIGKEGAANTFTNCKTESGKSGGGICFSSTQMTAEPSWPAEQWAPAGMTIESYAGGTPYGEYLTRNGEKYTAYRSVSVERCTFDGCQSSYGGGFYVPNNAKIKTLVVKNVTVSNGVATSFLAEADGKTTTAGGRGAGIALASYAPGCSITLDNVEAFNNRSDLEGGGVFIDCMAYTSITVSGGQYYDNTASIGGGIYIDGNNKANISISFTDSKIYNNTSAGNGGGVYLNNSIGTSTFTNVEVYGNLAGARKDDSDNIIEKGTATCFGNGGGLYLIVKDTGTVTFTGGVIGAKQVSTTNDQGEAVVTLEQAPNRAFAYIKEVVTPSATPDVPPKITFETGGGGRGGGINVTGTGQSDASQLVMNNTQVCYNQSEYCGGGIYTSACNAQLNNVTLSYNRCAMLKNGKYVFDFREVVGLTGGGITVSERSTLVINGGIITHNKARDGGGLDIQRGSTVTMQNVQLTYNEADKLGGGAFVGTTIGSLQNTLIATGCAFSYNEAGVGEGGGHGGGLVVYSRSVATLTDTKFNNNKAYVGYVFTYNADGTRNYIVAENDDQNPNYHKNGMDKDGNPVYKEQYGTGGGVYGITATVNFYGVDVYDNEAGRRGGGVYGESASNFSIYNYAVEEGKTDYLNEITTEEGKQFIRSKIRNNVTRDYAGGIGSVGNLDRNVKCYLLLQGTLVEENRVLRYGGGGVYISSLAACTITEGTVIQKNTAQSNAGGIYANIRATVNVQGAEVIHNTTGGNGGGVVISSDSEVVITGGSISNNTAANNGGGVYASGSAEFGGCRVTIKSGMIHNNTAGGNGGGVFAGGSGAAITEEASSTVTIEGGQIGGILENGADGGNTAGGNGGGVYACKASTVTITDGTITANHAVRYGGGVSGDDYTKIVVNGGSIISNTAGSGGGVSVEDHANIEVKNGRIASNTARALWNENETKVSYGSGGGIFANGSGLIIVTGGDITENQAYGETYYTVGDDQTVHSKTRKDAFTTARNCGGYGGGIYAQGRMTVEIKLSENQTSGKITKNYASQNGGGIYAAGTYSSASNYGKVTITIEGGQIGGLLENGADGGNTAGGNGGGIYVTGSNTKGKDSSASITISGGTISHNKANGTESCGGGIATNAYSEVTFTGGTITNNSAYNGAGLYAIGYSSVEVNGGQISSNTASHYGGGIYSSNAASVTLESGMIEKNTACYGGGIYANGTAEQSSTVTVNNGEICNNTALFGYGGGLFVISGATLTVNNGKIYNNKATHTAVIDGATVTKETGGYGGGICATGYVSSKGEDYGGGKVILEGGEIYSNEASKKGGGIYATGHSKYKNVAEASSVTINGGTIRNNTAAQEAGGVYANNCANVSISDGMIYENEAYNGGGLYAGTNSQVTITGGEIKENVANNGGGGIYASGYNSDGENLPCNVLVDGGKISGNKAKKTEVDGAWTNGSGGGICATSGANVTVSNGEITANTAIDGGGIYADTSANVTITGGYIGAKLVDSTDEEGNPVEVVQKASNTAEENGGGIYTINGASATVSDGVIAYNEAKLGGGLYASTNSQVTITGGQIYSNSASEKGGGIYATNGVDSTNETIASNVQISGGKLYNNTAVSFGGGIYATYCADVTVSNGEIYQNSAIDGGGIYANDNADVTVTGGLIYSNTATGSGGGIYAGANSGVSITGGYIGAKLVDSTDEEGNPVTVVQKASNTATENGGGIYATLGANVTVSNGSIAYNEAVLGGGIYAGTQANIKITGGQIYSNSANNDGGGIYATSTSETDEDIASSVTVSGGKLYSNKAAENGGGIYATYCADVNVSNGEIYQNTAKNGGGICANNNSDVSITGGRIYSNSVSNNGGGIYAGTNSGVSITGGTIGGMLEDGTTVGNTAAVNGGGIYAAGSAQVSMMPMKGDDTAIGSIIGNKATENGGGVYATDTAKVTLQKGDIKTNSAQYGGGIYASGADGATQASQCATVLLEGGTVAENTATNGAGICASNFSTVTIESGLIDNNTAVRDGAQTGYGGGIYADSSATVVMQPKEGSDEVSGGVISNNGAFYGGGVYITDSAKVTISAGEIINNTSSSNGGGVYMTTSQGTVSRLTVNGGKISNNTSETTAGGIYVTGYGDDDGGIVTITNGEINNNVAKDGNGGGVALTKKAQLTVSGGTISGNTATRVDGSNGLGGGILQIDTSSATISGGTVSENQAYMGGGIYTVGSSKLEIYAGDIIQNTVTYRGAGIAAVGSNSVTIEGGKISENISEDLGGGIYGASQAQITVKGGEISSNEANTHGGGIALANAAVILVQGGKISKNTSTSRGGGIYGLNTSKITVVGGEISDNRSASGGGVALNNTSKFWLKGGKISGNTATSTEIGQGGGGLYAFTDSTAYIQGGEISGNTAIGDGGGIMVASTSGKASVTIEKITNEQGKVTVGTVKNNTADNGGGICVYRGGNLRVEEGHIFNNTAVAPKNANLSKTGKEKTSALHGAGGGICVMGTNYNGIKAIFTLTGTKDLETGKMNVGIYGNTATFSGDEVFSNGYYTSMTVPLVSEMNLDGYDLDIVGWFEDYNTGDTSYTDGLDMKAAHGHSISDYPVKRYRNSTANDREKIDDQYVTERVNLDNAYVAMALGIPNASDDTVIVDYGLSVDIDLLANDMLLMSEGEGMNPATDSKLGLTLPDDKDYGDGYGVEADKEILYSKRHKDGNVIDIGFKRYLTDVKDSTESILNCGTAIWKIDDTTQKETGVLTYTMNSMEMASKEVFYYAVPGDKFYYYGAVNVIPATSIYFEDNCGMVTYHESSQYETLAKWEQVTGEGSTAADFQAQDRPGASSLLDSLDANNIYGYDGSYTDTKDYSNGSAYKVTVNRHKAQDKIANNGLCDYKDKATGKYCYMKLPAAHEYVNDGFNQCKICRNTEDKHSGDIPEHECSDIMNYNEYCDICCQWIGTHTTSARASFTFTGSGFDIISLCNKNTGIVMVSVYKGTVTDFDNVTLRDDFDDIYVASYMVDTYYGYDYVDGQWKPNTNINSNTSLYQVPVIKADLTKVMTREDDPATENVDETEYTNYGYGTYTVEIYVSSGFLPWELSYASCDFYLDSIRIYNPAGIGDGLSDTVLDAYKDDGEAWPAFTELRDMLISQKDFGAFVTNGETKSGVVFIDGGQNGTSNIADYISWGPNNEVYLNAGQSVAFTMNMEGYGADVAGIHLGMRGLTGKGSVLVKAGTSTSDAKIILEKDLSTTDLYYDIGKENTAGKVVVITNDGTTPIAISNVKVTHRTKPDDDVKLGSLFSVNMLTGYTALEILTPEVLADPVLTPKYPALSFEGMVSYNVFFTAEDLGSLNGADLGLAVFDSYNPEGTVENAKDVIMGATQIDGLYMVATNGVHAKYLGDTQYFRAFAKKSDGSYVYSKMVSYSALDYAKNVLAKSNDVKLKQLVVAMLNYGSEAQKYFGYKTDDLMNKNLTVDEQALVSGIHAGSLNAVGKVDASKVGIFASTGGFAKKYPAISFKGAFEINYFMAPSNAVDGDMTLYCWNEDTYNGATRLTADNADRVVTMTLENGLYTASSDQIAAKDLDETVYVAAVYESNGISYCSGVLPYSIAAYCQKPSADVADLANAAAVYGCAAKEFFGA